MGIDKEIVEKSLPEWARRKEPEQSQRVKRRIALFMERYNGSLQEKAAIYYRIPPEDSQGRNNLITPDIEDYEVCEVMWKKFGIRPWELEQLDANWVTRMLILISEDNKAEVERIKRQ